MAALLKRLDKLVLVFGKNAGEHGERCWGGVVGNRAGRADCAVEANRVRHNGRGCRRIAGHHNGTDA